MLAVNPHILLISALRDSFLLNFHSIPSLSGTIIKRVELRVSNSGNYSHTTKGGQSFYLYNNNNNNNYINSNNNNIR